MPTPNIESEISRETMKSTKRDIGTQLLSSLNITSMDVLNFWIYLKTGVSYVNNLLNSPPSESEQLLSILKGKIKTFLSQRDAISL